MVAFSILTNCIYLEHEVTVFDQHRYNRTEYQPEADDLVQAASVDHNKIVRLLWTRHLILTD